MGTEEVDVIKLIEAGTHTQLDCLAPTVKQELIAESIMAMANCSGGKVIVGINETIIVGVDNPDRMVDTILESALSLSPALIMSLPRVVKHADHAVVIADVPDGLPYIYAYNGRYLRREGSSNAPIEPRTLRRLMIERGEFSFETEIAHNCSLDDIDWKLADRYANSLSGMGTNNTHDILYHRGCLTRQNDSYVPTHAGILLFGKTPQRVVRGTEITAVRFASDAMTDTFNRQDITGTLPEQIRRAETFLVDHLRKSVTLKNTMMRHEDYEYPMEAVRELVVNAVAHRDYSIQGDNIRVFIYSNHMEVHSPGSLPGPMTIENLKEERFSRNPVIVQILSDMGFIERLGYGVDRVIELMQTQGLRPPSFSNNATGFKVVVFNQPDSFTEDPSSEPTDDDRVKTSALPKFNGTYRGHEINPRQESALVFLSTDDNTRITNSDLKNLFPEVHPETIRRDLVDLVNKNILRKMGQKRGSYYILIDSDSRDEK